MTNVYTLSTVGARSEIAIHTTLTNTSGATIAVVTPSIPEPANAALMLAGLGIMASLMRRRRS